MGNTLFFPEKADHDGISIEYIKSRGVLRISGWFDGNVGIEATEITVAKFCEQLGIKLKAKYLSNKP